nr:hypothetical protein Iba_chr02aCG12590 [Ipomoea batatas]
MKGRCVQELYIVQTLIRRLLKQMSNSFLKPFVERFTVCGCLVTISIQHA